MRAGVRRRLRRDLPAGGLPPGAAWSASPRSAPATVQVGVAVTGRERRPGRHGRPAGAGARLGPPLSRAGPRALRCRGRPRSRAPGSRWPGRRCAPAPTAAGRSVTWTTRSTVTPARAAGVDARCVEASPSRPVVVRRRRPPRTRGAAAAARAARRPGAARRRRPRPSLGVAPTPGWCRPTAPAEVARRALGGTPAVGRRRRGPSRPARVTLSDAASASSTVTAVGVGRPAPQPAPPTAPPASTAAPASGQPRPAAPTTGRGPAAAGTGRATRARSRRRTGGIGRGPGWVRSGSTGSHGCARPGSRRPRRRRGPRPAPSTYAVHVGPAVLAVRRQRAAHDLRRPRRGTGRSAVDSGGGGPGAAAAQRRVAVRRPPGQQQVGQRAEGVLVGARVGGLGLRLLGGDVGRGAGDHGQPRGHVEGLAEPEVADHRAHPGARRRPGRRCGTARWPA